jgi:hypothetical protein
LKSAARDGDNDGLVAVAGAPGVDVAFPGGGVGGVGIAVGTFSPGAPVVPGISTVMGGRLGHGYDVMAHRHGGLPPLGGCGGPATYPGARRGGSPGFARDLS